MRALAPVFRNAPGNLFSPRGENKSAPRQMGKLCGPTKGFTSRTSNVCGERETRTQRGPQSRAQFYLDDELTSAKANANVPWRCANTIIP